MYKTLRALLAALCVPLFAILSAGCAPSPPAFKNTDVTGSDCCKDFRLSDHRGQVRTLADFRGKVVVMFFGYTQCPDICPTALGLMKDLQARLGAVPPAPTFQVVFISIDPARDTHALLGNYLAAFDPAFVGITGDDTELAPLTKDLGVFFQRNDTADKKNYTVDHSAAIYLINPKGQLVALFSPPQAADKMAADYRRITAQ